MKKHLFPIKKCTACALLTAVFITGLTGCGSGSNVAAPYNYSTVAYASVDPSPYINTSSHGETTVYDDIEISFYDLTDLLYDEIKAQIKRNHLIKIKILENVEIKTNFS